MSDPVNHPEHYTKNPSGIECIEITQWMNFNLGNVVKYIWRCDEKEGRLQDLQKALWYLNKEIELEIGKKIHIFGDKYKNKIEEKPKILKNKSPIFYHYSFEGNHPKGLSLGIAKLIDERNNKDKIEAYLEEKEKVIFDCGEGYPKITITEITEKEFSNLFFFDDDYIKGPINQYNLFYRNPINKS